MAGKVATAAAGVREARLLGAEAASCAVSVVRWPPAAPLGELFASLAPQHGSIIAIVPDEHRANRLLQLAHHLGRRGCTWRSDQTARARTAAWIGARMGTSLVVGGRLAVLAPVPDLAAIIIFDDGDDALKEERSPTWHARELAVERCRRTAAQLTFVASVPTVDSEAIGAKLVAPSRAAERAGWPTVEVIDRRGEQPALGLFSERLVEAMRAALERDGRVVCIVNRRGRARLLACSSCDALARCEACNGAVAESDPPPSGGDPSLTHADPTRALRCGRCGVERPWLCAACGSVKLRRLRLGVSKAGEELEALLRTPVVKIEGTSEPHLAGSASVVMGTEAALHRVERADLVAFLDFDQELLVPWYRGGEAALRLVVLAARLVGQRSGGGRVVIQTRLPDHEVIEAATHADPERFVALERERRRRQALPPWGALAVVKGEESALERLAENMRAVGIDLGVIRDGSMLVRAGHAATLCDALAVALPAARSLGRLRVEMDPLRA